jgi:hypothetical protein
MVTTSMPTMGDIDCQRQKGSSSPCLDATRQRCTEVGVYIRRKESGKPCRRLSLTHELSAAIAHTSCSGEQIGHCIEAAGRVIEGFRVAT